MVVLTFGLTSGKMADVKQIQGKEAGQSGPAVASPPPPPEGGRGVRGARGRGQRKRADRQTHQRGGTPPADPRKAEEAAHRPHWGDRRKRRTPARTPGQPPDNQKGPKTPKNEQKGRFVKLHGGPLSGAGRRHHASDDHQGRRRGTGEGAATTENKSDAPGGRRFCFECVIEQN